MNIECLGFNLVRHMHTHTHTQNIDSLERRAGLNPDLLVEAHGGFSSAHCVDCGHGYSQEFVKGIARDT